MIPLGAVARGGPTGISDGPFGSAVKEADYRPSGVPVLRGGNLSLGECRFRLDDLVFISDDLADRHSRAIAQVHDVVFTKKGTIGSVGIIPVDTGFQRFFISSNQMKATIDSAAADPLFIYYVFAAAPTRDRLVRESSATGVPKINLAYLRAFLVPLPPLDEQRRIAAILGALDDKIELNRKMNRTLEELAQALFKSWFIDFDGHDDLVDSEIGPVPRGWEVKPIGDAVKVMGGSTPSTKEAAYWEGGTHAWATPKDLSGLAVPVLLGTERQVTDAGLEKISSGLLPAGTFLLSSRAPIGYTAISQVPTAINQGFIAIPPGGDLTAAYLLFWTRFNMDVIKGRAGGTTFAEISKAAFRPIPVAVPPQERMGEFERLVGPLMGRIVANARESATLTEIRDTLLPKLISGEVRLVGAQ
jgi:type I restriction enzyme S subunit